MAGGTIVLDNNVSEFNFDNPIRKGNDLYVDCLICGEVNESMIRGFYDIFKKLSKLEEKYPEYHYHITINFSSPGGFVTDGFVVGDIITRLNARKDVTTTVRVVGECCSMGVPIVLSSPKRQAGPNSFFMIHSMSAGGIQGNVEEMENTILHMKHYNNLLKSYIRNNTVISEEEIDMLFKKDSYFFPDKAVEYGIVQEIK